MPKITAIRQTTLGHLSLDLDDGTMKVINRGEHEPLNLQVGDEYPTPTVAGAPVEAPPVQASIPSTPPLEGNSVASVEEKKNEE